MAIFRWTWVLGCCSVYQQLPVVDWLIHTQPSNGLWSVTIWVGRYQKKHSPTHTHPDHRPSFIYFLHFLRSNSLFSLRAWQSSSTTSLQVLFDLPLGLGPSTSYSMHFFTQSSSSFRSTCPYHCGLFCCNTNAANINNYKLLTGYIRTNVLSTNSV